MTETGSLAKALAAFQGEMPTVAKGKKATVKSDKGSYSYTYAGLAEVSHAALPLLSKHGLAFVCVPEIHERGPVLTGVLFHTSGETLRGSLPIATGGTPQQTGSAITYARRYLFGAMTGLVTEDDDDGQIASQSRKAERINRSAADDAYYDTPPTNDRQVTTKTNAYMFALFAQKGVPEDQQLAGVNRINGTAHTSRSQITEQEALAVIEVLKKRPVAKVVTP